MPPRKTCIDCSTPIAQPKGRGRPRLRCSECAWLKAKQQKREALMRMQGIPRDKAEAAALWGPVRIFV
jgi:hypothetical protein